MSGVPRNSGFADLRVMLLVVTILCVASGIRKCHAAEDTWLTVSAWSHHIRAQREYNERNYGVGLQYEVASTVRLVSGVYRNSYSNTSLYLGAAWQPELLAFRYVRFGVFGGIILFGYEKGPLIGALPTVTFPITDKVELNFTGFPQTDHSPGLITGNVGVKFW